jgi:hypothetical protein
MDKDPRKVLGNPESTGAETACAFMALLDRGRLVKSNNYNFQAQKLLESILDAQRLRGELDGMKKARKLLADCTPK